jgi:hypothetical protein
MFCYGYQAGNNITTGGQNIMIGQTTIHLQLLIITKLLLLVPIQMAKVAQLVL